MMLFEIDGYIALKKALADMCAELMEEEVPEGAVFDCKLIANELLSNALRYGGGSARFCATREGDTIRISVKSACDFTPPEKSTCSGTDAECGRGLYIVDAMSESRKYNREDGICVVVKIR